MPPRNKRETEIDIDNKLDSKLIKRIKLAVLKGNRQVFVILTNGFPWTPVIVPIMVFGTSIWHL